jgi:hypothetical protein
MVFIDKKLSVDPVPELRLAFELVALFPIFQPLLSERKVRIYP